MCMHGFYVHASKLQGLQGGGQFFPAHTHTHTHILIKVEMGQRQSSAGLGKKCGPISLQLQKKEGTVWHKGGLVGS